MKLNRNNIIYVAVVLFLAIFCALMLSTTAFAANNYDFENFTEKDAIAFVEEHNIKIPEKMLDWEYFGAFTKDLILQSYRSPNTPFLFNYYKTQKYAEDIRLAVGSYVTQRSISTYNTSSYSLQYNTVMDENGNWVISGGYYNPDWENYNCYAYATNRCEMTNFYNSLGPYQIGDMSMGEPVETIGTDILVLAEAVKSDLEAMGYSDVYLTNNIPEINNTQQLICIRKDYVDFHFMIYDQQTDAWYHKPGNRAILKYNYTPSNDKLWWQEYSYYGVENYVYGAAYDSDIIFIKYSKNILNTSGTSQGINILPNKDVFYEVNIDTSNHYRLRLSAGYEMDYELYNSDFDVVVSDSNTNNVDTCLSLAPGKYYLRINFTSSQSYSGLSASIGVGYDEHNCVNSSTHSSVCSGCGNTITKSHDFVCDGVKNSLHYEKCADCGYRANQMTDYQCTSLNSTQHEKECNDCGYSETKSHTVTKASLDGTYHQSYCSDCGHVILTEAHTFTYTAHPGRRHSKTCSCGYSTTEACVGRASIGGTSYCVNCGQEVTFVFNPMSVDEEEYLPNTKEDEENQEQ